MQEKNDLLKTRTFKNVLTKYLFMFLGCICYSASLRAFLIPNEIVGGGVSGASSLIEILTGIDASIFIIAINLPILIGGYKMMGRLFIFRCLVTTATLSLTTYLLNFFNLDFTDNKLLASIYGGILQGIGIGLFIKYEMSSGGTELLGRITYRYIPILTIASHVAVLDGAVVFLGAFLLKDIENILYAFILLFVSAKISDIVVMGLTKAKLCYIITSKAEVVSQYLITHSPRGVTLINGEGVYSKKPKGVLLTCVKNNQVVQLKAVIKSLDDNAFVIVCDANEVYGKGFNKIG